MYRFMIKAPNESDISVWGPEDPMRTFTGFVCQECPRGHALSVFNALQMYDHVVHFHIERGDLVWANGVQTLKAVASHHAARLKEAATEKATA